MTCMITEAWANGHWADHTMYTASVLGVDRPNVSTACQGRPDIIPLLSTPPLQQCIIRHFVIQW